MLLTNIMEDKYDPKGRHQRYTQVLQINPEKHFVKCVAGKLKSVTDCPDGNRQHHHTKPPYYRFQSTQQQYGHCGSSQASKQEGEGEDI